MILHFDIRNDTTRMLKDRLGWLEPTDEHLVSSLIAINMILCDRVIDLEEKLKDVEQTANYARNTASTLANGGNFID